MHLLFLAGCGSSSGGVPSIDPHNGPTLPVVTGDNVVALSVNGSTCAKLSYMNKPCVSIKVCNPGTSTCVTVNDILLDTGSTGLRIYKPLVATLSLTQLTTGAQNLATCEQFVDGTSDWGPVKMASIVLGNEPAVQVPIQVIDSTFSNSAAYCPGASPSPSEGGLNGILGIGLLAKDCGDACVTKANNGIYFGCTGATCSPATATLVNQVTNPVSALPKDNNGVILQLPSIGFGGVDSIDGYLVLGIGTQTNNIPGNVTTFSVDASSGEFKTDFNGKSYAGFIDSGSNAYYFPSAPNLTNCASTNAKFTGFYCPSSLTNLSGTDTASVGAKTGAVRFQIGNFLELVATGKFVFVEAGSETSQFFDWGLPFFIGRNVYVGIVGTTSSLGTGPYWAF